MNQEIKVMVVDDTITYRQILSKVVESLPGTRLVGTAMSGNTALMKVDSLKPDLILLDVMMPELDGLATLQILKKKWPEIQIIMISSYEKDNAKATMRSLEYGALDFIAKPIVSDQREGIQELHEKLLPLVSVVLEKKYGRKSISSKPRVLPRPSPKREIQETSTRRKVKSSIPSSTKIELVVIGISTGGPNSLQKMLPKIAPSLPCPVIIVQHMPPLFTSSLAERLQKFSRMEVKEAEHGEIPKAGGVYIAPGGKHLVVRPQKMGDGVIEMAVIDTPPVNHCKPSVDVLFRSVARLYGKKVLSVIMTGMGRDGTEGVEALKKSNAYCLVQDEETSVVWGMPRSVYEKGLADEVLALEQISDRINQIVMK